MLLVEKMDEGPVIACGIQEIADAETTASLTQSLVHLSDALLAKELPKYLSGETKAVTQDVLPTLINNYPTETSYSRKLTKEDGRIDWTKPAEMLEHEIRAYIEWPKSYTNLDGLDLIITKAHVIPGKSSKPGEFTWNASKDLLIITTVDGSLGIEKLKPAGKKEMTAAEFLRGYSSKL
jgi:methionyl-tRNA formyltransferase